MMTLVVLFISFFALLTLSFAANSSDELPVLRLASPISEQCSSSDLQREKGIQKRYLEDYLVKLSPTLTERHGPPCSCGASKWTRIAHLNMTDTSQECPSNWTLNTSPVKGCGRSSFSSYSQDSVFFSSNGKTYFRVCGQILAYHKGYPEAFINSVHTGFDSIDDAYVDGISLTHGPVGSRQHIWTFAAAAYETNSNYQANYNCMCTNTNSSWPFQLPSFINNNYFCDTGDSGSSSSLVHEDDPLWDGTGCGPTSTCCEFNKPPWFCTLLPRPTSDDIEIRISNGERSDEDVIVFLIDLYIQ